MPVFRIELVQCVSVGSLFFSMKVGLNFVNNVGWAVISFGNLNAMNFVTKVCKQIIPLSLCMLNFNSNCFVSY